MKLHLDRRELLGLLVAGGAHALSGFHLLGCGDPSSMEPVPAGDPLPFGGVTTSLPTEHDYIARIEGTIPRGLRGTLYRNGPGLFDRGELRKRCIVDGDGAIHQDRFGDGEVRFRNRFVQTEKYVEEQGAGAFLYDTWTTKAPGTSDIPSIPNQAGVSVWKWRDRLYAFDEGTFPFELDPDSLDTVGLATLGLQNVVAAHPKKLAETGEWAHFGLDFASGRLHLAVLAPDGTVRESRVHQLRPTSYVHDFFPTASHIVVHLQPAILDLNKLLTGNAVRDSIAWRPEEGSRFLLFKRGTDEPPVEVEATPGWQWHTIGTHVRGNDIVCEWVGYDDGSNALGDDADICTIMSGTDRTPATHGTLRRTILPLSGGTATEEVIADLGGQELPQIHRARIGLEPRYAYTTYNGSAGVLWSGLARTDLRTGTADLFDFGAGFVCGEPVFAPAPDTGPDIESGKEPGWLLSEVGDSATGRAQLAIFDAEHVADGPIARVHLEHHLPLKFHGEWNPA